MIKPKHYALFNGTKELLFAGWYINVMLAYVFYSMSYDNLHIIKLKHD